MPRIAWSGLHVHCDITKLQVFGSEMYLVGIVVRAGEKAIGNWQSIDQSGTFHAENVRRIEGGISLIAPAGFVVMKKPPIGGAAAIGRGHDGR